MNRRQLFQAALVAGAALALPNTELITDAEEVARRYWALDQTHIAGASEYHAIHEALGEAMQAPQPWWRVGQVIGESRYMTTLRVAGTPDTLRVGQTIQLGDLGANGIYNPGLPTDQYIIRHIDRDTNIITVHTPLLTGDYVK